jgi:hypothetical protein
VKCGSAPGCGEIRPVNDSGVDVPETRYATTIDGLSIAYQVLGKGPFDLVYTESWISNVDAAMDAAGSERAVLFGFEDQLADRLAASPSIDSIHAWPRIDGFWRRSPSWL